MKVVVDPRVEGTETAIRAKNELQTGSSKRYRPVTPCGERYTQDPEGLAKAKIQLKGNNALAAQIDSLSATLDPLEQTLMQVNMRGQKAGLAFPGMLNELFASFAASQEDADTAPTTQHRAMYESLHKQLEVQLAKWSSCKQVRLRHSMTD